MSGSYQLICQLMNLIEISKLLCHLQAGLATAQATAWGEVGKEDKRGPLKESNHTAASAARRAKR